MMEFITPCVLAKFRDTFFVGAAGSVLHNFWTLSYHYWLFLLLFFNCFTCKLSFYIPCVTNDWTMSFLFTFWKPFPVHLYRFRISLCTIFVFTSVRNECHSSYSLLLT